MLAIRLQRTGRKGHAQFRVIVQDSHRSPSTGKIIQYLGSYDPHTKEAKLDKESIEKFISNGAQPSNRVALLLKSEGYKLPKWVKIDTTPKGKLKNPEKLRKNQPDEPKEKPAEETPAEEPADDEPKDDKPEETKDEAPAEEKAEDKPAEEAKEEPKDAKSEEKPAKESKEENKEEK